MMWGKVLRWSMLMLLFFQSFITVGQNEALSQVISISVNGELLRDLIPRIESASGLTFSYNPEQIDTSVRITFDVPQLTIKQVLERIAVEASLEYRIVEQQIVLRHPTAPKSSGKMTLHGTVKDYSSGETLIGATVFIPELNVGVATNTYGFYSLSVPRGRYRLQVSYIGYDMHNDTINPTLNKAVDIELQHASSQLEEVVIKSKPTLSVQVVPLGRLNVTGESISDMPAPFGEEDVLKSLESVPGISFQSDGSTFFYTRGGEKDQNLILIDEAPIYNPTHLIGLFSTILPEAVKSVQVYKGTAPATVGGRLSSVINVNTREGNNKHFKAWGSVGLASTKLGVEGPFKKDRSSYMLTGRLSRLKWFFKQNNPGLQTFQFYDVNGKVNFRMGMKNKLFASFYTGKDELEIDNSGVSWTNLTGTLRWNHLYSNRLFSNTTLFGSNYEYFLNINTQTGDKWRSRIGSLGLKSDFSFYISPNNLLQFGLGIIGYTINPGNIVSNQPIPFNQIVSVRNASEVNAYVSNEVKFGRHVGLLYGVRLTSWTDLGSAFEFQFNENHQPADTLFYDAGETYNSYSNLEPRITLSWFINKNNSLKFSYDRNVQNLHLISNSSTPFSSFEVWLPSSINIRPQLGDQLTLGYGRFFHDKGIELEANSYYKRLSNQIDYIPHAETLLNQTLESTLRFGKSDAYGVELTARKEHGKLRGWVGYTYARIKRKFNEINNGLSFNGLGDRPHQVDIVLAWDVSKRWTLSTNWTFNSGIPTTTPIGFYKFNGAEVPLYDQKNNNRMPDYHRLDVSARLILNKHVDANFRHSITLALYNVYARKNPVFINFNKVENNAGQFETPGNLFFSKRVTTRTYIYSFTPSITYQFTFR